MTKQPAFESEAVETSRLPVESPALPSDVADLHRLLHELQVQRIELENQNEELRRSQYELGSSRARYFELYDQAPIAYLTLDGQGDVLETNLTAAALLGVERSLLVRQPLSRYILPEDLDLFNLRRTQLLAAGTPLGCELRMLKKDGGQFWVNMNALAVQDRESGEPVCKIVLSDISERKETENALRASDERLSLALVASKMGVWEWDLQSNTVNWSPECHDIVGLKDFNGTFEAFAALLHPDDAAHVMDTVDRAVSRGSDYADEFRIIRPDGELRWLSNLGRATYDGNGVPLRLTGTVQDITECKRMEDDLRQALEAAETVNVTMSRLLRIIAHEFRSPLGVLTGSTDILDSYRDRLTPGKRSELHEHIRNASCKLTDLISSVVAFNRMGTDRSVTHPLMLEVGDLCSSIAAGVESVWGAGQKCTVTISPDCGAALLDETLFRRTVENLLTNAFRYTPADGTVSFTVRREESRLALEIRDSGIGIPPEDQALIFDAFYRSRNVEWRGGLGLGLSIARESVSQMGGTITVQSRIGEGTVMRLEIPVDDPA